MQIFLVKYEVVVLRGQRMTSGYGLINYLVRHAHIVLCEKITYIYGPPAHIYVYFCK